MTNEITNYLFLAAMISIGSWSMASFLYALRAQRILLSLTAAILAVFAYLTNGFTGFVWLFLGGIGIILGATIVFNIVSALIAAKIRRSHGDIAPDFISPARVVTLLWH